MNTNTNTNTNERKKPTCGNFVCTTDSAGCTNDADRFFRIIEVEHTPLGTLCTLIAANGITSKTTEEDITREWDYEDAKKTNPGFVKHFENQNTELKVKSFDPRADKNRFPCYGYGNEQDEREETTFWDDFSIAERFGFSAIKDTFKRAFEGWRNDIKYLAELAVVMNHKCWYWCGLSEEATDEAKKDRLEKVSEFYSDAYYKVRDFVFADDTKFTKEERTFFYNVLD